MIKHLSPRAISRISAACDLGNIVGAYIEESSLVLLLEDSHEYELTLRDLMVLSHLFKVGPRSIAVEMAVSAAPLDDSCLLCVVVNDIDSRFLPETIIYSCGGDPFAGMDDPDYVPGPHVTVSEEE